MASNALSPPSSRRRSQRATVSGVTRNRRASSAAVQPVSDLMARISSRSAGVKCGRLARGNSLEAGAKEAILALDEGELRADHGELAGEADARQGTVLGPGADEGHAAIGERDGAQPSALHVVGPLAGQGDRGRLHRPDFGWRRRDDNTSMYSMCAVVTAAPAL